jgi:peptidoglycan-associated lipoprotein
MMRKWMIVLVGLVFACSMIFLMTSCQKTVSTETPTPAEPTKKSDFDADKKAKEMAAKAEADTKAKLAALKAQKEKEERERQAALARLKKEISLFESRHIYFDFDRAELKPESRNILKTKAAWLKAHTEYSVRIEGHCDERGTNEYNIALGERRANAAWKYLNALGISGDRMDTVSYGEERPIDTGHDESAWRKNRRDQFKLMK